MQRRLTVEVPGRSRWRAWHRSTFTCCCSPSKELGVSLTALRCTDDGARMADRLAFGAVPTQEWDRGHPWDVRNERDAGLCKAF